MQTGLDNNKICSTVVMVVIYRTKQKIITWPLITCVKTLMSHLGLAFCSKTDDCAVYCYIYKNEILIFLLCLINL